MIQVAFEWKRIAWLPDETWGKQTLPKLLDAGLTRDNLKRSVYIIRLYGDYCIEYPGGCSPVLYIGEGRFGSRITRHRRWLKELRQLVGNLSFQLCITVPRFRDDPNVCKDCEAFALQRFKSKFGSAPLWNKQIENRLNEDYRYDRKNIDRIFSTGRRGKFKWSIKPMKTSQFYHNFTRTHRDPINSNVI